MKLNSLTTRIIIAMIIGATAGYIIHTWCAPTFINSSVALFQSFSTIFLRLVQMIITPLVFSTLVVGITKLGDIKTIGRVGGTSLIWFVASSLVSLLLGMVLVNVFQPGVGMNLNNVSSPVDNELLQGNHSLSLQTFIEHIFPKSLFAAMAKNEVLQVVVFSIFFGVAVSAIGEKGKIITKGLDAFAHAIFKVVDYVMAFAPVGVLGAIAAVMATKGPAIFIFYGKYLLFFAIGIAGLWLLMILVGWLVLRHRIIDLLKAITPSLIIAFSTTSSEAVFPKLTEDLEKLGCKPSIISFVLPLGYSFNLDGSMMYMTFASIAIAQAYGIHLGISTQIIMLLFLMFTSKGIAGVPRASLVVVLAACTMFGIPPEGVALILPIDHICDMFRSATNVLGNSLATMYVNKREANKI